MSDTSPNARIVSRGREFFDSIRGEKPSLFNKEAWMGKVMDWCMRDEHFKVRMFRFVDVFPALTSSQLLRDHIRGYFGHDEDVPTILSWGARAADVLGSLGGLVLQRALTSNIRQMAQQFIVGENSSQALAKLSRLRQDGFAFVVDVLGEATVTNEEAERYVQIYLELVDALLLAQAKWRALASGTGLDWGHAPMINVSIKPTALCCHARPMDFEGTVTRMFDSASRIMDKVVQASGFLCIDMESRDYKDITIELFKRLRRHYRNYPHLGIVLQTYLRETDRDLDELLAWGGAERLPFSVRLVKGAYWDYEVVRARQNGWPIPVYTVKAESDAAFERCARKILENHEICHFACASHNVRSIAAVMEWAAELKVPPERYEFQVLYGMAEPVRKGLLKVAQRIRLYCPYGDMVPGMGYLVRRLLENTANESFLRQSFAEGRDMQRLLADPLTALNHEQNKKAGAEQPERAPVPCFSNEALADFSLGSTRDAFRSALVDVRKHLGKTYPLHIGGKDVLTSDLIASVNPAAPGEIIGKICQAGIAEVKSAIACAKQTLPLWRSTDPAERADCLTKAAAATRRRIYELAAWQVLEIGKQWDQAYADVAEAVDFLEYYACEMRRLAAPRLMGTAPGELNHYLYEPKGVAAVIAPWNFPLAIGCGMAAAAIVTGNCVVFKPSGLASVIGRQLVEIFAEAGLPPGVFNFVPGCGSVIGDFLVEHPDISLIAFTGSMETGLRIIEHAARIHSGQLNLKKVVCEMGGKNAIIIDEDADFDEAVGHVLYSAFGFQGQKCSACSRLIVLDSIYERFVERLVESASALRVGPAEDPANYLGAVADGAAQRSILEYIEIGKKEGRLLYCSPVPRDGFFVPLTIIGDIRPEHRLAQEEIFGPLLALMRARDFEQALEWANSTRFALTGAVFSRLPEHIECARRDFRVGNLYINRASTGAMVERQPFGGARMSGTGTKAGGPDYLLHFMDPRVVTENTLRRGFAPDITEG